MKTSLCVKTISLAVVLALAGCGTTSPMLEAERERAGRRGTRPCPQNGCGRLGDMVEQRSARKSFSRSSREALAGSPDLAIAMERVRQAEAQVRVAGASLFPSLDLGVGTSTRTTRDSGRALYHRARAAPCSA